MREHNRASRWLALVMFGFCIAAFAACSSKDDSEKHGKIAEAVKIGDTCDCWYVGDDQRLHDDGTGKADGGWLWCVKNDTKPDVCWYQPMCKLTSYCTSDCLLEGVSFVCIDNILHYKSSDGGVDATVDSSGSDTSGSDTTIVDSTTDTLTDSVADTVADTTDATTDSTADSVADVVVDSTVDSTVDSVADAGSDTTDAAVDVAADGSDATDALADSTDSSSDASSDGVSDTGPCIADSGTDASASNYVLRWVPPSWYVQTGAVNLIGQTYDGSVADWSLTPGTGLIALVPDGCGAFVGSISLPSGTTFEGNVKHADTSLSPGGVGWVFDTSSKDGGGCVKTSACCGLNFGTFTLTKGGVAVPFNRISNRTFGTGADATCPVTAPDLSRPALVDGGTTNGEVYFNIQFTTK